MGAWVGEGDGCVVGDPAYPDLERRAEPEGDVSDAAAAPADVDGDPDASASGPDRTVVVVSAVAAARAKTATTRASRRGR